MTDKLPCPFCGGKPYQFQEVRYQAVSEYEGRGVLYAVVECSGCGARVQELADEDPDYGRDYDEAHAAVMAKWNRRTGK